MTQMIGIYIFPPAGPAFETGVPAVALGHLGHPQLVPQDAAAQGPPPLLSDICNVFPPQASLAVVQLLQGSIACAFLIVDVNNHFLQIGCTQAGGFLGVLSGDLLGVLLGDLIGFILGVPLGDLLDVPLGDLLGDRLLNEVTSRPLLILLFLAECFHLLLLEDFLAFDMGLRVTQRRMMQSNVSDLQVAIL